MKKVVLKVKELENMGYSLCDIKRTLEVANIVIESAFTIGMDYKEMESYTLKKFLPILHEQLTEISDKMDTIAYLLMNADDANNIEEYRGVFN